MRWCCPEKFKRRSTSARNPRRHTKRTAKRALARKLSSRDGLVEGGVSFVLVSGAWGYFDHHGDNVRWGGIEKGLKPLLPRVDRALYALINDLERRGMLGRYACFDDGRVRSFARHQQSRGPRSLDQRDVDGDGGRRVETWPSHRLDRFARRRGRQQHRPPARPGGDDLPPFGNRSRQPLDQLTWSTDSDCHRRRSPDPRVDLAPARRLVTVRRSRAVRPREDGSLAEVDVRSIPSTRTSRNQRLAKWTKLHPARGAAADTRVVLGAAGCGG